MPGASTLDPPHVSFNHQSYTSLIYIFYSNLYITNINSIHSYLQYSCLIPVVPPGPPGTHVLSCGTALANAQLSFGAGGMPPALVHVFHLMAQHLLTLSCLIPVMVCMFNPSSGVHISSESSELHLWHSLHLAILPVWVTTSQVGVYTRSIFDGSIEGTYCTCPPVTVTACQRQAA